MIKIELVRKYNHALGHILIPTYILGLSGCFSFLIPAKGGERFGFIMTIVLGMIFNLMMIDGQI